MTEATMNRKAALSVKNQTLAALGAIFAAVALPQLFHVVGAVSGTGTALGETFLPMHLPVILVGMLAGPFAGAAAGLLSPAISFLLSGMPGFALLPFMMLELCVYGLIAGLLNRTALPSICQLLITQVAGRAVRAAAILLAVGVFHSSKIGLPIIWTSIATGLPGLLLQWSLLPLIAFRVRAAKQK